MTPSTFLSEILWIFFSPDLQESLLDQKSACYEHHRSLGANVSQGILGGCRLRNVWDSGGWKQLNALP